MRVKDKVVIVTGGAQGIGQSIAIAFANEGAQVVSLDMSDLKYAHPSVDAYTGNVLDRETLKKFVDAVHVKYGHIDVLVNNAGITRDALTEKMSEEMWDLVVDINLKGVFNLTQLVAPIMMAQGKGSIINIASVVGEFGNVGQSNYAATKAGVIAMGKTWAKEFARKGAAVRVNSVAPGYVNTDMMKTVPEKVLEPIRQKTMLGRLGEPEEIAAAVLFLGSDESSFITGHNLSVNGGLRL